MQSPLPGFEATSNASSVSQTCFSGAFAPSVSAAASGSGLDSAIVGAQIGSSSSESGLVFPFCRGDPLTVVPTPMGHADGLDSTTGAIVVHSRASFLEMIAADGVILDGTLTIAPSVLEEDFRPYDGFQEIDPALAADSIAGVQTPSEGDDAPYWTDHFDPDAGFMVRSLEESVFEETRWDWNSQRQVWIRWDGAQWIERSELGSFFQQSEEEFLAARPNGSVLLRMRFLRELATRLSRRLSTIVASLPVSIIKHAVLGTHHGPTIAQLLPFLGYRVGGLAALFRAYEKAETIMRAGNTLSRFFDPGSSHVVPGVVPQFGFRIKHEVNDGLASSITDLVNAIKAVGAFFSNMAVKATGGEGALGKVLRSVLKVALPICMTVMVCKLCAVPVGLTCRAISAAASGLDKAIQSIFMGAPSGASPQWGESGETDKVARFALAATVAALVGKKVPSTFWVALVSRLPPFVSGAKNAIDWMLELFQWCLNGVLRLLNKDELEFFRKRAKQADDWYERVLTEVRAGDGTAPGQPERVCDLYAEGKELMREYSEGPSHDRLKKGMRELDAIYGSANAALSQIKGARPEPCTIILWGDPGVGKSVLIKRLHAGLMAMCYSAELSANGDDATRMMYSKDPGKYWDGYNSNTHKSLLIDDVGAKKQSSGGSSGDMEDDYSMIMRVVNTAACPLNMAHLEAKGTSYFRSPFVIMTSNLTAERFMDEARLVLATPDAVMRRLQMFVEVKRRAGKGKVTPEELRRDDSWTFTLVETINDVKSTLVFDDVAALARHVVLRSTQRQLVFQSTTEADRAFIARCREPVPDPAPDIEPQVLPFLLVSAIGGGAVVKTAQHIFGKRVSNESLGLDTRESLSTSEANWFFVGEFASRRPGLAFALASLASGTCLAIWRRLFTQAAHLIKEASSAIFGRFGLGKEEQNIEISPQGGVDAIPQADRDLYLNALYTVRIRAKGFDPNIPCGNIMFVRGRAALLPSHYLEHWSEVGSSTPDADLVFTNAKGESFIESASRFRDRELGRVVQKSDNGINEDVVLVEFNTREHKDVVGRFATRSCHGSRLSECAFVRFSGDEIQWAPVVCKWGSLIEYKNPGSEHGYVVTQPISYSNLLTFNGDCGAILHSVGSKDGRCLYGIHVAGSNKPVKQGHSAFISREWLEAAYTELTVPFVHRFNDVSKLIGPTTNPIEPQGDAAPESCVVAKSTLRSTSNALFARQGASMVPTQVTGWAIGDSSVQAQPLQPSDCTHASTLNALRTYCEPARLEVPASIACRLAEVAAVEVLNRHGLPRSLNDRLLTIPEAISGRNVYGRFAEPINRVTSPGYPWRAKGITKDKLFDIHGNLNMDSEAYAILQAEVKLLLDSARQGKELGVVFQAAPKAESRKPGKLPRLIQGAPLHYVVVWRMLFWPLMAFYGQWSPEKELGLGLNPLGEHWPKLWSYMEDFSPHLGAGDYKQFDQSQEMPISLGLRRAILGRYPTSPDSVARATLWLESCGPHVILGDLVYKLPKGMPSGHPATGLINGLYNCTLFTMSYALLEVPADRAACQGDEWRDQCRRFSQDVRLAVVGDDNLFSTRSDHFNELTLPRLMQVWGARYTMDVKDGVAVTPTRSISEVTFIGRTFETRFGRRLAPLRMDSIRDMGNWSLKSSLLTVDWYTSVYEQTAACLAMHDTSIWREYLPLLNRAYGQVELSRPLASVDEQKDWADKAQALFESHYTTI